MFAAGDLLISVWPGLAKSGNEQKSDDAGWRVLGVPRIPGRFTNMTFGLHTPRVARFKI